MLAPPPTSLSLRVHALENAPSLSLSLSGAQPNTSQGTQLKGTLPTRNAHLQMLSTVS